MDNRFDGFTVNLYLNDEGDWFAHFVEMPEVSAFADTPEQALQELAIAWEGVREDYPKHGEVVLSVMVSTLHRACPIFAIPPCPPSSLQ